MSGNRRWLFEYLKQRCFSAFRRAGRRRPIHILFFCTDHFEPGTGRVDRVISDRRMEKWITGYPLMAKRHRDFDGRCPRHGWFYPPHYFNRDYFSRLNHLCFDGLGEVELHLHHSHDTAGTLKKLLEKSIADYNSLGMLLTIGEKPEIRYAFIHGMWSLDNARGPESCGVNSELLVLSQTGCFADFTFPSGGPAQPRQVNSIYYAEDDPDRPKSYDRGKPVVAGGRPWGDLLIFQGPLSIDFSPILRLQRPRIELAGVNKREPGTPDRIDGWVRTGVHVKGRPDWIFIKISTHSAQEENHGAIIGDEADRMYAHLERHYNDGENFRLHYVTAREAYNIVKAAEAGMEGNPFEYRDFLIKPYANTLIRTSSPYRLRCFTEEACALDLPEPRGRSSFCFKNIPLARLEADRLTCFEFRHFKKERKFIFHLAGLGKATVTLLVPPGMDTGSIELLNARLLERSGKTCLFSLSLAHSERKVEVSLAYR